MIAVTGCRIFCLPVLLSKNIKIEIYRTIISPVDVYGCETWSLTLRDECRLRMYREQGVTEDLGLKETEATGDWRRKST